MRHDFEDGKYTLIQEEYTGRLHALRYGEYWRDLTGDKMVRAMLMEVHSLRQEVQSLRQQLLEARAVRSGQTPLAQSTPPAAQTPAKPSPFAALARPSSGPAPTHPTASIAPEVSEEPLDFARLGDDLNSLMQERTQQARQRAMAQFGAVALQAERLQQDSEPSDHSSVLRYSNSEQGAGHDRHR